MFSFLKSFGSQVATITGPEAVARSSAGDIILIDVRELAEIKASGTAKGALHIPLSLIPIKANPNAPDCPKELAQGKPIVVFCLSGARSNAAAKELLKLGYENVANLGGFSTWQSAGGAVVQV